MCVLTHPRAVGYFGQELRTLCIRIGSPTPKGDARPHAPTHVDSALEHVSPIGIYTPNLTSLELTFMATQSGPVRTPTSDTHDGLDRLKGAYWPKLQSLLLQGICVHENTLVEFLRAHRCLSGIDLTDIRMATLSGSWSSFLQRKSEWKGYGLTSARFSGLRDEMLDGGVLAVYPATASIEEYVVRDGAFPDLSTMLLV